MYAHPKFVPKDDLNLTKLRWTERLTAPRFQVPLFVTVSSKQYLITDFSSPADFALEAKAASFEDGLLLSLDIYGANSVTLEEWLALRKIAAEIDAALSYPKGFTEKLAFFLESLTKNHIKYLSDRKVIFSTLRLLAMLEEGMAAELLEFALKEGFSSQRFKRLVEDTRDFGKPTLDRRSERHKKLDELLEKVKRGAGGCISVNAPDFHELGALEVSFRAQSTDEYQKALKGLSRAAEEIEKYFNG